MIGVWRQSGRGTDLIIRCRVCLLVLMLPLLNGCLVAAIVGQVVPAAFGITSLVGAEDRSPFRIQKVNATLHTDEDMAELDLHIRQAGCGDAPSQFWLASALQNGFNTTPNNVEIYKWYLLAESGGYVPAREELTALGSTMSESEIAEAGVRAQAWQATTEGCTVVS